MTYIAQFVSQSGKPAILAGEAAEQEFKVKNIGTHTWNKTGATPVRLGTKSPQDRDSGFYDSSDSRWLSPSRIEMVETSVAPQQTATFRFNICAENLKYGPYDYPWYGTFEEHFSPVCDGVAWMSLDLYRNWSFIAPEFPYSGETNAFKGQLHVHTNETDGAESPYDTVDAYKSMGYDFIALTDHNKYTPDPGVEGITFIPAVEEFYSGTRPHIAAYDIATDAPDLGSAGATYERHHPKALLSICHPDGAVPGYGISQTELDALRDYRLFEVFNGVINQNPPTSAKTSQSKYLTVLTRGRKVWCTAVDDAHQVNERNKGWVVVHADSETKDDLMDALRAGNFYSSTGSDLTLTLSGTTLTCTSPHAGSFRIMSTSYSTPLKTATNTAGGSVEYEIQGTEPFIWVKHEKTGSDGITDCAWANPVFIRRQQ